MDSCTRQRASGGYRGTPTKLFGVAYRRSIFASGTTVRTSTKPAARAWSRSGGTPALGAFVVVATTVKSVDGAGDAGPRCDPPQAVPHAATSRPTRSHRTLCTSALSRVPVPLDVHRGDP